jgi:uncharacterized membrane protein YhhN
MNSVRTLSAIVAVAALALVALLLLDLRIPAAGAKLIASSSFIGVAIVSGAWQTAFGRLLLAGLALSWCGDMFLIGTSRTAFLSGLVAFLLAHVAYVAAFIRHGYNRTWTLLSAIPVAIVAVLVYNWLQPHIPAELDTPVRSYIAVISLMVVYAFGTRGAGGSKLILAGALLFYLSDLSVAALRLVQTDWPTYILGLPLYYGGQLCLALSVSHSRSH